MGPITPGCRAVTFYDVDGQVTEFSETALAFRAMPGLAAYEVSSDGDLILALADGRSAAIPASTWVSVIRLDPDNGGYTTEVSSMAGFSETGRPAGGASLYCRGGCGTETGSSSCLPLAWR
jgi:hypothetical protein